MKKFKYKVVKLEDYDIQYKNILNSYGEEGWELVNVLTTSSYSTKLYYFKKEVELKESTPPKLEGK